MLSQTSEHALRAVLFLARTRDEGLVSAERVATAIGAPPNYLAKTLNALAKAGVVESMRGATGGFRLAYEPGELTLAQVVEPFDDPQSRGVCLLGDRPCTSHQPCASHGKWMEVSAQVWEPLRTTTIQQLLGSQAKPISATLRFATG